MMKKLSKLLSILFAAVFAAAMIPMTASADEISGLEKAQNSVVYVTTDFSLYWFEDLTTGTGRLSGSGFAIGDPGQPVEYIITNAHVVSDELRNIGDQVTVWFSEMANKFMIAEVYAIDFEKDLCVLRLPEPTTERNAIPLTESDSVKVSDKVYALGFPDYGTVGQNYATMNVNDLIMTDGIISKKYRVNINGSVGFDAYMHSAATSHGNSGGPLVNENGEVIGINTWVTTLSEATASGAIATIVDELIPILDSNKVPYTLASDVTAPADTGNAADAPSPSADDAVVSAAEPAAETQADTEAQAADVSVSEPEAKSDNNNTVLIIVLIAVVVAAAVVIVVVVTRSRKASAPQPAPQPVPQPVPVQQPAAAVPSAQGAVISGMKGFLAGRQFNVSGSVILGRNTQKCSVCFPVDAPGISGVHCEIRRNGSGYEIIDKGSSCGTFLGSGQKLVPDVPVELPSGTYFYLGSPEQLFQIKY